MQIFSFKPFQTVFSADKGADDALGPEVRQKQPVDLNALSAATETRYEFPVDLMRNCLSQDTLKRISLDDLQEFPGELIANAYTEAWNNKEFLGLKYGKSEEDYLHLNFNERNRMNLSILHHLPFLADRFKKEGEEVYDRFKADLFYTFRRRSIIDSVFSSYSSPDLGKSTGVIDGFSLLSGLQNELDKGNYPNKKELNDLIDSLITLQIVPGSNNTSDPHHNLERLRVIIEEAALAQDSQSIKIQNNLRGLLAKGIFSETALSQLDRRLREFESFIKANDPKLSAMLREFEQLDLNGALSGLLEEVIEENQDHRKENYEKLIAAIESIYERETWHTSQDRILAELKPRSLACIQADAPAYSSRNYLKANSKETSNYYSYLNSLIKKLANNGFKTWYISDDFLSMFLKPLYNEVFNKKVGKHKGPSDSNLISLNRSEILLKEYFNSNDSHTNFTEKLGLSAKFVNGLSRESQEAIKFIDDLRALARDLSASITVYGVSTPYDSKLKEQKTLILSHLIGDFIAINEEGSNLYSKALSISINSDRQNESIARAQTDLAKSLGYNKEDYSVASDLRKLTGWNSPTDFAVTVIEPEDDNHSNENIDAPHPHELVGV